MKIKEIREQNGMSQKEAAARIGVSAPALCRWESGERLPNSRFLPAIAKGLRCKISDLFEEGSHE